MTSVTNFRIYYLDDSGSTTSGYTTFTWLSFAGEHWQHIRDTWTQYRADLALEHSIPASWPLHATDLAGGHRWHASADDPGGYGGDGAAIVRAGLEVIADLPWSSAGTAYRLGGSRGTTKYALYRAVLDRLETELRAADSLGLIFMDGGVDHRLIRIHLDHQRTRGLHLVEQPQFHQSGHHQGVQMADLAAWAAYQAIVRKRGKAHTWTWYADTIGRHDPHGPRAL